MKNLLLITSFFITHYVMGQYKIDKNIEREFETLFSKQPKNIQAKRFISELQNGFAILQNTKEDTLNIKDFTPTLHDSSYEIIEVDSNGNEIQAPKSDSTKSNQWLSCQVAYFNDTLQIKTFLGLLSGFGFSVKISHNKVVGDFFEYIMGNSIYRYLPKDNSSSRINVDAEVSNIILNKEPQKMGEVIYGKATLVTKPFYVEENNFFGGYIYKRYRFTFLFTGKLTDKIENSGTM